MNKRSLFDLTGKVAIVTGSAGGIGRVIALGLAAHGSDVVIADRISAESCEVTEKIKRLGRKSLFVQVDVTDIKGLNEMVNKTVSKFNRIDILVNNAGCNIRKPALEIKEEEWDKVIDTNMKGVFLCTQAIGRFMVKQRKGKIINIASVMGLVGSPDYQTVVPYCASKGGVVQLTRAFATEWAKYNIQVNAIAPATVETPLVKELLKDKKRRDRILKMIPLGRLAKPEEMAGPAVFLASSASDFMTGHVLCFDGGWLAQ
jgi:NAD(P)-dependent dehydrogenase (short-subunit alcohol dehydrogenase family)